MRSFMNCLTFSNISWPLLLWWNSSLEMLWCVLLQGDLEENIQGSNKTRYSLIKRWPALSRHLNNWRHCKSFGLPLTNNLDHSYLFESSKPLSAKGFTTLANAWLLSAEAFPRRYLAYTPCNRVKGISGRIMDLKLCLQRTGEFLAWK